MRVSPPSPSLCIRCKGKLLCGLDRCPILVQIRRRKNTVVGTEIHAPTPPSVFVGWKGYPKVEVAPGCTVEDPSLADDPGKWRGMSVEDVLTLRSSIVRPVTTFPVASASDPPYTLVEIQEAVMSRVPVDVDAKLRKAPKLVPDFSDPIAPIGPKSPADRISLADTPKPDRLVEKMYYDDLPAEQAVELLFDRGRDVYTITKVFSAGVLGRERNRRLVPTRWAITAVDDIIYRRKVNEIRALPLVDKYFVYHSHLFDNHFYIILLPERWGFELMEAWAPGTPWGGGEIIHDWEGERGRKTYADNVGGSYYAARLAVIEHLLNIRKQARAVIIREVREGYFVPLGVWQVRENVRAALEGKPETFSTLQEVKEYLRGKTRIPVAKWFEKSALLKEHGKQMTLF